MSGWDVCLYGGSGVWRASQGLNEELEDLNAAYDRKKECTGKVGGRWVEYGIMQ